MKKAAQFLSKIPIWAYYVFFALLAAVSLTLISGSSTGFAEWYSENIYPVFVFVVGGLSGLLPFSLFEILIYAVILFAAAGIIYLVFRLIKPKIKRSRLLMRAAAILLCSASSVYLAFTLFCGINYQRTPFSVDSGLSVEKYTAQELADLCVYLLKNANACAEKIEVTEQLTISLDSVDIHNSCKDAMSKLGGKYGSLSGFYPSPKAVISSEIMSHARILGVYSPITIEANYNCNAPDFTKPVTLCHELSHLKGFMREDEASFIAYLACIGADSDILNYCGYVYAFMYASDALYSAAGTEVYSELLSYANEKVVAELRANSEYWKNYETPVAQVAATVNDSYLKSQGQSDGARSYGRFVDLMIYDYKNNHIQ